LKLRIAIDVLAAFSCLVVRLQAVAHAVQKVADNCRANLMTLVCTENLIRVDAVMESRKLTE
jgi:hypothetical protein